MIILASGSPRRRELLKKYGMDFEILVTDVDESAGGENTPDGYVTAVSRRKAEAAVEICRKDNRKEAAIVAADTIVFINGRILGKPDGRSDAFSMLKELAGNWHRVYTGLCVALPHTDGEKFIQDFCVTGVKFKPLTDSQIDEYINTGEPFDKAGAYAIQGVGAGLIEEIDGDYNNIVGLPVELLLEILRKSAAHY